MNYPFNTAVVQNVGNHSQLYHTRPLQGRELCNTDDFEELSKHIGNVLLPHRCQVLSRSSANQRAVFHHAPLSDISVNYLHYGAEASVKVEQLGFFLIEIPLSGISETQYGKARVTTNTGSGVVAGPYQQFSTRWNAECSKLLIKINRLALEQHLSMMLGSDLQRPLDFSVGIDLYSPVSASLWHMVQWLVAELENSQSLLNNAPMGYSQYEQMLMWVLLNAQPNNYSAELASRQPRVAPHYVHYVEDYVNQHSAEAITLSQLVEISGVSGRTLLEGFRRYKGTSPMKYLKSVRMERVHEELKNADPGRYRVTEIALAWGFTQLGKFSVEYKQRFGESPSDTLKK
ncbi:MAG: AraC family transcriptional regulator [Pseudomonadales bacterium]|nr:AraC family transcriptional regulator [Pseudomonadales bacterium]